MILIFYLFYFLLSCLIFHNDSVFIVWALALVSMLPASLTFLLFLKLTDRS
jgi:hypothetical protein